MKTKQVYTDSINFILEFDKDLDAYFTNSNTTLEISSTQIVTNVFYKSNNFNNAIKNILEEKYGYVNVKVENVKA